MSHFWAASKHGEQNSMLQLIAHYDKENDKRNVLKYVDTAARAGLQWKHYIQCYRYPTGHEFKNGEIEGTLVGASQPLGALLESMCYFFGVGSPQSRQKAADALPTFGSNSYTVSFDAGNPDCFSIRPDYYRMIYENGTWGWYLDFLLIRTSISSSSPCFTAVSSTHSGNGSNAHFLQRTITALMPISYWQSIVRHMITGTAERCSSTCE